jgi:hypothetical protein
MSPISEPFAAPLTQVNTVSTLILDKYNIVSMELGRVHAFPAVI